MIASITPDMAQQAFRATGLIPRRGTYLFSDQRERRACAMGAIACQALGESPFSISYNRLSAWVEDNIDGDYAYGFQLGFDGESSAHVRRRNNLLSMARLDMRRRGHADGAACAEAVGLPKRTWAS